MTTGHVTTTRAPTAAQAEASGAQAEESPGQAEASAALAAQGPVVEQLGDLLCRAVRALGKAGDVETASWLAARGWWATRDVSPPVAAHLNGVLHYLAGLSDETAPTTEEEPTVSTPQLDVRSEPPARRHDLILSTYAELGPGEGFVLVNDHDPKPLYYQFAAEHAGQFTWDYLETGPEVWRVRIGRPGAA